MWLVYSVFISLAVYAALETIYKRQPPWIILGVWVMVIVLIAFAWNAQGDVAAANKAAIGAGFLLFVHVTHWLYTKAKGGAKKLAEAIPKKTHIDDAIYDQIAEEISAGNINSGLMTRAIAEADGDKDRTQAIYIKLRAAAIATEREQVVQDDARGEAAESKVQSQADLEKELQARRFKAEMIAKHQEKHNDGRIVRVSICVLMAVVLGISAYTVLLMDSSDSKITTQARSLQYEYVELAKAHPDYAQIANDPTFHEWVKTQPVGIQKLYESTSAQDNIVLLHMYKRARAN